MSMHESSLLQLDSLTDVLWNFDSLTDVPRVVSVLWLLDDLDKVGCVSCRPVVFLLGCKLG